MKNYQIFTIIVALLTLSSFQFYDAEAQAGQESAESWEEYQKQLAKLQESIDKPPPRQQIANGIRYLDVVCSNDFVLLFKWSGNSSACVKPQSAEKIIERGWGVPKDQTVFLGTLSECETDFTIHYDDPSEYKESKIIKTIRDALSEVDLTLIVGDYTYQWEYISILNEPDNEGKANVSVEGSYRENASELEKEGYRKIIEALQSMDGVTNVELRTAWCR